MNDRADALHGNGRLSAWSALVGASALYPAIATHALLNLTGVALTITVTA